MSCKTEKHLIHNKCHECYEFSCLKGPEGSVLLSSTCHSCNYQCKQCANDQNTCTECITGYYFIELSNVYLAHHLAWIGMSHIAQNVKMDTLLIRMNKSAFHVILFQYAVHQTNEHHVNIITLN